MNSKPQRAPLHRGAPPSFGDLQHVYQLPTTVPHRQARPASALAGALRPRRAAASFGAPPRAAPTVAADTPSPVAEAPQHSRQALQYLHRVSHPEVMDPTRIDAEAFLSGQSTFWHRSAVQTAAVEKAVEAAERVLDAIPAPFIAGNSDAMVRLASLPGAEAESFSDLLRRRDLVSQQTSASGGPRSAFVVRPQPARFLQHHNLPVTGVAPAFEWTTTSSENGAAVVLGATDAQAPGNRRRLRWEPVFGAVAELEHVLGELETMEGVATATATTSDDTEPSTARADFSVREREDLLSDGVSGEEPDEVSHFLDRWLRLVRQRMHVLQTFIKTKLSNKTHMMTHRAVQVTSGPAALPLCEAGADAVDAAEGPLKETTPDIPLHPTTIHARLIRSSKSVRLVGAAGDASAPKSTWLDSFLGGESSMVMSPRDSRALLTEPSGVGPRATRGTLASHSEQVGATESLAWLASVASPGFQRIAGRITAAVRLQSLVRGWRARKVTGNVSRGDRTPFQSRDGRVREAWLRCCGTTYDRLVDPTTALRLGARRDDAFDASLVSSKTNVLQTVAECVRLATGFVAVVAGGAAMSTPDPATEQGSHPPSFVDTAFHHYAMAFRHDATQQRHSWQRLVWCVLQLHKQDPLIRLCFHLLMGDLQKRPPARGDASETRAGRPPPKAADDMRHELWAAQCMVAVSTLGGTRPSSTAHHLELDADDHILTPALSRNVVRQLLETCELACGAKAFMLRLWKLAAEVIPSWAPLDDYTNLIAFDRTTMRWLVERRGRGSRERTPLSDAPSAAPTDTALATTPTVTPEPKSAKEPEDDAADVVERKLSHKQLILFLALLGFDPSLLHVRQRTLSDEP